MVSEFKVNVIIRKIIVRGKLRIFYFLFSVEESFMFFILNKIRFMFFRGVLVL